MKTELIFMGAPASGKGTQTKMLAKDLGLSHVDTGSMLRSEIASGSEEGQVAKSFIDKGNLVPVEIVAAIIKNRLLKPDCNKGFILDGYPRSIEQAEILDSILDEINAGETFNTLVINLDVDEEIILNRIINRRVCSNCGKIYNLEFYPPEKSSLCDDCDGELLQRHDDTEKVVVNRLETYKNQTQPLIDYYKQKNLLKNIDANGTIEEVYNKLKDLVLKTVK